MTRALPLDELGTDRRADVVAEQDQSGQHRVSGRTGVRRVHTASPSRSSPARSRTTSGPVEASASPHSVRAQPSVAQGVVRGVPVGVESQHESSAGDDRIFRAVAGRLSPRTPRRGQRPGGSPSRVRALRRRCSDRTRGSGSSRSSARSGPPGRIGPRRAPSVALGAGSITITPRGCWSVVSRRDASIRSRIRLPMIGQSYARSRPTLRSAFGRASDRRRGCATRMPRSPPRRRVRRPRPHPSGSAPPRGGDASRDHWLAGGERFDEHAGRHHDAGVVREEHHVRAFHDRCAALPTWCRCRGTRRGRRRRDPTRSPKPSRYTSPSRSRTFGCVSPATT